jgi:hypothetical protein
VPTKAYPFILLVLIQVSAVTVPVCRPALPHCTSPPNALPHTLTAPLCRC